MPSDAQNDLVLVTAAGGQQAANLLPLIYKRTRLRRVVYSVSSQKRLSEPKRGVAGAAAVYHIGPTFHPFETWIGYSMMQAALAHQKKRLIFKHFVYSSVMHTQLRKIG